MLTQYEEALAVIALFQQECPNLWRGMIDEPLRIVLQFNRKGIKAFHEAIPAPHHAGHDYILPFGGEA